MKTYLGIVFGIWLAVTGLGVLALGIGWNQTVLDYFGALPNANRWAEIAPAVYIVWVLISGLSLIGAGGFIGAWALVPAKTMPDVQSVNIKG